MSLHVAITGANGFVGRALCRLLKDHGHRVRALTRTPHSDLMADETIAMGQFNALTDWSDVLQDVDVVVHARVHVMKEKNANPLVAFRKQNVEVTRALCTQAHEAGVKRLIYLSSIKVNGEATKPYQPFTALTPPQPQDSYGLSKWEAEQVVMNSPLESVILRPPLVYGPHVKANFLALLKLAGSGLPVPFGCLKNKRSMIYMDNLASAIEATLSHPAAAGQTYLLSDQQDLSVKTLYQKISKLHHKKPWLLPIPVALLDAIGTFTRKQTLVHRLTQSLEIDSSPITQDLAWTPPYSVTHALKETLHWYQRK